MNIISKLFKKEKEETEASSKGSVEEFSFSDPRLLSGSHGCTTRYNQHQYAVGHGAFQTDVEDPYTK